MKNRCKPVEQLKQVVATGAGRGLRVAVNGGKPQAFWAWTKRWMDVTVGSDTRPCSPHNAQHSTSCNSYWVSVVVGHYKYLYCTNSTVRRSTTMYET